MKHGLSLQNQIIFLQLFKMQEKPEISISEYEVACGLILQADNIMHFNSSCSLMAETLYQL